MWRKNYSKQVKKLLKTMFAFKKGPIFGRFCPSADVDQGQVMLCCS
jgi:hypothetical protein